VLAATATPSCCARARRRGATVEQCALEIRHLQRTEARGGGAVPGREAEGLLGDAHKRNPVKSEAAVRPGACCADLMAGLRTWHSGTSDISHSSVERVILPDACLLAYYLLVKMRAIVEGMVVYPERMLENLDDSYGLVFSQPVLLAIVESGLGRDGAYRMVQRNAMKTWEERRPFLDVLEDPEVVTRSAATLEACFDLKRGGEHRAHVRRARRERRSSAVINSHTSTRQGPDLYEAGEGRMLMVAPTAPGTSCCRTIPDKGQSSPHLVVLVRPHRRPAPQPRPQRDPTDPGRRPARCRRPGDAVRRTEPVRMEASPVAISSAGRGRNTASRDGRSTDSGCGRRSRCRSRCSPRPPRPTSGTTCR
jgi:hypothetical protein